MGVFTSMTSTTNGLEAKVRRLALKRKSEIESDSVKIIYYNNAEDFISTLGDRGNRE